MKKVKVVSMLLGSLLLLPGCSLTKGVSSIGIMHGNSHGVITFEDLWSVDCSSLPNLFDANRDGVFNEQELHSMRSAFPGSVVGYIDPYTLIPASDVVDACRAGKVIAASD